LPKKLDNAFATSIRRINPQSEADSKLAMLVLMWLAHARRKLTPDELRHALAVIPHDPIFKPGHLMPVTILVDCCMGLVVIEPPTREKDWSGSDSSEDDADGLKQGAVSLVHFSLREYLTNSTTHFFLRLRSKWQRLVLQTSVPANAWSATVEQKSNCILG
jgi:hypothetical protein